jgi:ABC-2 type transport system permease protein
MGKMIILAGKDLKLLMREKASLFWVMMFPLLIALFFGSIFSGSGGSVSGMKVAVIDNDKSDFSAKYVEELEGLTALKISRMPHDSAFQRVRTGKLSAFVVLREGFGKSRGLFSEKPLVEIGIDPARRMESGYLQGLLTRANFTLLQKQFGSFDSFGNELDSIEADDDFWGSLNEEQRLIGKNLIADVRVLMKNLETEAASDSADTAASEVTRDLFAVDITAVTKDEIGPRSSFEITFPSAMLWALIGCAATFAVSIVKERTAGTFLRLRLAPLSRAHILGGKGLACFAACVTISIILLLIGNLIFGVRFVSPVVLGIGILSAALCFVGLTMCISVLGKTEESVGGASWGILLVAAMSGGGMIPVIFMPNWLLTVSHFSPVKWAILAVEGGIWRDFTISEMLLPVGMLLGIGIVCFGIGVTVLSRSDA